MIRKMGLGRTPFGFKRTLGEFKQVKKECKVVRGVYADYLGKDFSFRGLSKKYGLSLPMVQRILSNPFYANEKVILQSQFKEVLKRRAGKQVMVLKSVEKGQKKLKQAKISSVGIVGLMIFRKNFSDLHSSILLELSQNPYVTINYLSEHEKQWGKRSKKGVGHQKIEKVLEELKEIGLIKFVKTPYSSRKKVVLSEAGKSFMKQVDKTFNIYMKIFKKEIRENKSSREEVLAHNGYLRDYAEYLEAKEKRLKKPLGQRYCTMGWWEKNDKLVERELKKILHS